MPQAVKVSALAALAAIGSAGGVYLGRAAVAEINPAYFSEAETRFHGDLVPYRAETAYRSSQASELSTAEMSRALGTACIACRRLAADYSGGFEADAGRSPAERALEETAALGEEYRLPLEEEPRSLEMASVERYATYPITVADTEPDTQGNEGIRDIPEAEPVPEPQPAQ